MASSALTFDTATFGSSLSLRSLARTGSEISVHSRVRLGADNTYVAYSTFIELDNDNIPVLYDTVQVYADISGSAKRGITIKGDGGRLHGAWVADVAVSTSDRNLKNSIMPLYQTFHGRGGDTKDVSGGVSWVLRQLRPVSFKFNKGPEAKYSRYGFVAQELREVLPSLVRDIKGDGSEGHLAVVYQDLIALLTAAAQMLQEKVSKQEAKITRLEEQLVAVHEKLDMLLDLNAKRQERQMAV
ncbi:unnamed protein product [Effrenium voratum]|uniref:Peptidase S74 domain-containing protein n=1 Tax=Effrenium voratum TaxID=2562239 RepID=A0AA36NEJ8_9DINO|nr:unnamed protein product [Effrenium voratum]